MLKADQQQNGGLKGLVIGDDEAVTLLIDQLGDDTGPQWEEKRVCDVVADALDSIGTPKARAAVEQWRRSQAEAS